jgi:hypothetical protein
MSLHCTSNKLHNFFGHFFYLENGDSINVSEKKENKLSWELLW